jgi:hypothetical protein
MPISDISPIEVGVEDQVGGQLGRGPVVDARALCAVAAGQPLPGIGRGILDELVDAPHTGQGLDLLGLGHRDHIADVELFEQAAKVPVLPVSLVRGDPSSGQTRGEASADDVPGQFALGGKVPFVRDLRRPAAVAVGGPGFRQVEVPVELVA